MDYGKSSLAEADADHNGLWKEKAVWNDPKLLIPNDVKLGGLGLIDRDVT